jgi:hypothetical protein
MSYTPGDFSFVNEFERKMLEDAYRAVSVTESWDAMKADPGHGGFMFSNNEHMKPINAALKYHYHSGASYAFTMRHMQLIAKNGWDVYVSDYIKANSG